MAAKGQLTPKQQRFIEAYIANGQNGVEAAIAAGYKGNNATLRSISSENLTKPNIKAAIEKRLAPVLKSFKMSADEVLEELGKLGKLEWSELPIIDAKPADKLKALDMAMKFHGLYQDNRRNESDLQRVVEAITDALQRHPDLTVEQAVEIFAKGRNVPVDKVLEHLGAVN